MKIHRALLAAALAVPSTALAQSTALLCNRAPVPTLPAPCGLMDWLCHEMNAQIKAQQEMEATVARLECERVNAQMNARSDQMMGSHPRQTLDPFGAYRSGSEMAREDGFRQAQREHEMAMMQAEREAMQAQREAIQAQREAAHAAAVQRVAAMQAQHQATQPDVAPTPQEMMNPPPGCFYVIPPGKTTPQLMCMP